MTTCRSASRVRWQGSFSRSHGSAGPCSPSCDIWIANIGADSPRYAQILDISYECGSQEGVFKLVRSYYPEGTRFIVLPMDMEFMNAGSVKEPIDLQHAQLAELRDKYPDLVIPFAAADARRDDVAEKTRRLIEEQGFRGIKLYPPIGYHPNDPSLRPLYDYAVEHRIPVMTHCSRPASVQYRGEPTERMRINPETENRLSQDRRQLLTLFTDPDAYIPFLKRVPPSLSVLRTSAVQGTGKPFWTIPGMPAARPGRRAGWRRSWT